MESAVQNVAPSGRPRIESVEINLKRVFLPTLIAGWISGFGIIEYPLGHPRTTISILYASLIYGSFLIMNVNFLYSQSVPLRAFDEAINLFSGLLFIISCMSLVFTLSTAILHWTNQKKIKSCLRRLAEIKMEMKQLECNENHVRAVRFQKNQILIVIIALLLVISQIIRNLLQMTNSSWIVIVIYTMLMFYIFPNLINDIIFINYVTFIKWEFVQLNEKMTELFSELEEKLSMENWNDSLEENAQDYCDSIKTTRRLHLQLVKLSRRVNNVYGVQILLSLIMATTLLIMNLYNIQNIVKGLMSGNEFAIISISEFIWVVLLTIKILAINLTCARTIDEAHEIGYVIMKFNIEAINKRMESETRLFTMQLLQNPVCFTADGYFDLGYPCILLVIGIVIAYLSLLIENDNTDNAFHTSMPKLINRTIE